MGTILTYQMNRVSFWFFFSLCLCVCVIKLTHTHLENLHGIVSFIEWIFLDARCPYWIDKIWIEHERPNSESNFLLSPHIDRRTSTLYKKNSKANKTRSHHSHSARSSPLPLSLALALITILYEFLMSMMVYEIFSITRFGTFISRIFLNFSKKRKAFAFAGLCVIFNFCLWHSSHFHSGIFPDKYSLIPLIKMEFPTFSLNSSPWNSLDVRTNIRIEIYSKSKLTRKQFSFFRAYQFFCGGRGVNAVSQWIPSKTKTST